MSLEGVEDVNVWNECVGRVQVMADNYYSRGEHDVVVLHLDVRRNVLALTMFIIHSNCVRRSVALLVVWYHHRNPQLRQTIAR